MRGYESWAWLFYGLAPKNSAKQTREMRHQAATLSLHASSNPLYVVPAQAMKAYRGRRSTAPLILNVCANFTTPPLYTRQSTPEPV